MPHAAERLRTPAADLPAARETADRRASFFVADGHCEVDGHALSEHVACEACSILAGPGHLVPALRAGLCDYCRRRDQRRGPLAALGPDA